MEVAVGDGDEIAQPNVVLIASVMDPNGLGAFLEMVVIGLELGLELLVRVPLAIGFY
jgi:hypothetical protein